MPQLSATDPATGTAATPPGELPGQLSVAELTAALRRHTGRPELVVDAVSCRPIPHRISAPTTRALTRVAVTAHDRTAPLAVSLVCKELQAARYGLPPQMPDADRARLDAVIPWRLEAEVFTSGTADRMPPGLRMPALLTVHEQPGDRLALWMEDVDPVDTPWTDVELVRAAGLLGRLAARRADEERLLPPGGDFLGVFYRDNLVRWSVPLLLSDELWQHPLFALPAVAALRARLTSFTGRLSALHDALAGTPELPAHGDATPMNLLRARSRPEQVVAVDWGTASPGPVGFDVVPLVFGPAEAGSGPLGDVARLLAPAVAAYRDGLAAEGIEVALSTVRDAVLTTALLRYPCTSLPLPAFLGGFPVTPELEAHAVERAEFVGMVLDLEQRLGG